MDRVFGHDVICYNDKIEFAMEFCEQAVDVEEGENLTKELF